MKKFLEEKICLVCNRPFNWRKKWEKNWQFVKYCSKKCRSNKSLKFSKLKSKYHVKNC